MVRLSWELNALRRLNNSFIVWISDAARCLEIRGYFDNTSNWSCAANFLSAIGHARMALREMRWH